MSFVEPLFLAGLLAAALPVVVHLINRRKAVQQPFPPLQLLRESDEKEARSIKVRQWLLMALRILAIALLALALAKPYFFSSEAVGTGDRLPKAVVFVVDDTMSMHASDWWETAVDRIRAEVDALKPWDEVALITATRLDGPVGELQNDRDAVRNALEELAPSEQSAVVPKALTAAADILSTSELPNRRIVLVSDFTKGGFPEGASEDAGVEFPVRKISVRDGSPPPNVALTGVDYRQVGGRGEGKWEISVSVENFASEVREVELRLTIDGKAVAGGLVEVEGEGTASHTIRHTVEGSGLKKARVELVDGDSMPADDVHHFTFRAKSNVKVLLVNGAPSSVPHQDELFFTVRALNPGQSSESEIVPHVVTTSGFGGEDLSEYDVVLTANAAGIAESKVADLREFVRAGGGLLVAAGNQVDPEVYNRKLGELLPRRLRRVKLLAEKHDPDAPVKITHLGAPEREHPVFQVFNQPGGESLQTARVFKYMLLEPTPPEHSRVLLSYKDGAPALLERDVGDGRVFLWTTTLDRAWTDLPVRTAYLPLIRRSMLYLARRATSEGDASHRVGDSVSVEIGGRFEDRVEVRGPGGERYVLVPKEGRISFEPGRAGLYEISEADAAADESEKSSGRDLLVIPVNVTTEESRLVGLPDDAYDPWIGGGSASSGSEQEGEARAKKRVNIWPALLFAVTIALLLETLIGTRRSVLKKVWRRLTFQSETDVEV